MLTKFTIWLWLQLPLFALWWFWRRVKREPGRLGTSERRRQGMPTLTRPGQLDVMKGWRQRLARRSKALLEISGRRGQGTSRMRKPQTWRRERWRAIFNSIRLLNSWILTCCFIHRNLFNNDKLS